MKRFTLLSMLFALVSATAFAQFGVARHSLPAAGVAKRAAGELVTPPPTAEVETWYTVDGMLAVNMPNGQQVLTPSVQVAIDGADIYIQGLAYWFSEGWIKGTISGSTATFASGQYVGEDEYGPEYICGTDDAETTTDIVFKYDAEKGELECVTSFIIEGDSPTSVSPYCYWIKPVFSKTEPEGPKVVTAPEGLETSEWAINAVDNFGDAVSGYLNIGFDGNDVYLQGFCTYLPEAWIKGTLDGATITFPGDQYFGYYDDGPMNSYNFFLRSEGIDFTYDAEAGKMTAEGEIYIYTGGSNLKGDVYNNPVLSKVTEKAATPATPQISQIFEADAPMVTFAVTTTDTEGYAMASSKLTFQFLKDVEKEISPVTFTPDDYQDLTETMTEFPYGYKNGSDFNPKYIFLRQSDYSTWNKIGIQSIYTGGGEVNKSEVFWFTIKEYQEVTFDFNAMTSEPCSNVDNSGDITTDRVIKEGQVALTISPKTEEATTPNRFWSTTNGPQLRVYSGTLTFEVPSGKVITKMVFNNGKWNENNTADTGTFEGNVWTGEAQKVVVTIAGNTQLNSIVVTPTDYVPTAVEAPEDLVTDTYVFNAHSEKPYYDPAELTLWVKAGFHGDDLYIQGLAADYNTSTAELWVKATKNEAGQYVIPANQFMGSVSFWMSYIDCYFTAVDDKGNMVDAVLDFDEQKAQFTTEQTLVLNAELTQLNPYQTFTNVNITKFNEVAATPADPKINNIDFGEWSHGISCSIPDVGTNGETLNPQILYYTVWVEKAGEPTPYVFSAEMYWGFEKDATEVPFATNYSTWDSENTHSIYFYDEATVFDTWEKVGIQSIYYGAGECRKSNIDWIENPASTVGISTIAAGQEAAKTAIFSLSGQRRTAPQKGLNIINGRKVMVK